MNRHKKLSLGLILIASFILLLAILTRHTTWAVLQPRGTIADSERSLIIVTTLLGLLIVVPVFIMLFAISWRYRETNKKATYRPDWDGSRFAETIWWLVPLALIAVLSVINWNSTHRLDPFKPLASSQKPLTIQVVALQWKWLFIYPDQNIATVNYVMFPAHRPVNFQLTSDAPMNSFWIPQLSGQIYAMSGMSTQLHIMADKPGSFRGSSANISGKSFASMKFTAYASTERNFKYWVNGVKQSPHILTDATYAKLARPGIGEPDSYSVNSVGLYDKTVLKYMLPPDQIAQLHSADQIAQVYNSMRREH